MKTKATFLALIPIIFFSVSGGPYGLEEIVSSVGPINTLFLVLLLPLFWTIPECLVVAELSSTYPVQGGYYRWVQMGLGRFWGFMEGWWSILYTLVDMSLYPILFTTYLKLLFPNLGFLGVYLIQLSMIWSCALINILGIRLVGNVLTLFKIIILISFVIFVVLGMNYISFDFTPIFKSAHKFQVNNLLFGLSLAFWNYIGWDNASTILGEVDEPQINYHKAVFITIPIIVLIYFFPLLTGLSICTDWQNWKFGEFSFIANSMNHPLLAMVLTIGGMVMCLGLFNSLLLTSTRVISTMAEDKLFPLSFVKIHKKFNTPYYAIIFSAFVYSVLILVDFKNLVIYDVFLYLIALLLEAFALVSLRKINPHLNSCFKIPFGKLGLYSVVGIISFVIFLMVLINILNFNNACNGSLVAFFLVISGVPVYFLCEKLLKTAD